MSEATVQDYLAYDYGVEVVPKDGRFVLVIDELNLAVVADDVGDGYAKLGEAKRELFERYHGIGRLAGLPLPKARAERAALKRSLTPFLIKAGVVAVVAGILIAAANVTLVYTLQSAPKKLANRAARVAVTNFAQSFEKFYAREMSAEKEAEIREAIRKAIPLLRPYARELRPLFEDAIGTGKAQPQ